MYTHLIRRIQIDRSTRVYSQGDAIDPQGDQIDRTPTGRVASHLFKHGQHEEAENSGDLGDVEDIQVVMEDRV